VDLMAVVLGAVFRSDRGS